MFERFTVQARAAVVRAQREARDLGAAKVGTEHLLLAVLDPEAGLAYTVLHAAGVDRDRVREEVRRLSAPRQLGEDDAAALRAIGIDLDAVRARVEETFGEGALQPAEPERGRGFLRRRATGGRWFTPRAKKVLELSLREALHLGHRYIGSEHLLLGLVREGEGLAARILTGSGLTLDDLRARVLTELRDAA
ncbi:putative ATP-dependent Clp protease [Longispora fulva]|uniref:ATP-dependent Clp protease ATP-binding subunit ClpA n=1 Tax=Longispora fulva TaxID=619741 RepID=A0A8J7KY36_9ACTN|nr:Clp protease N-terminal domain-containing protein [Longispora fulva]MBG6138737.1 ATP-dependent Clp protease ATP-binding subunit ClpA [Longispora fulva]GIG58231.1 putative ATP-dependent Clp protease [Longispora fulva]